jgi:hypothetical protein
MRLTDRPAYSSVTHSAANTQQRGLSTRSREISSHKRSQRNVEFVRSIFRRWVKGDFSMSAWADADIEFCGPDLAVGRGIGVMASHWHDWVGTMDGFAVVPERFESAGDEEVLVLLRVIRRAGGDSGAAEVRPGVGHFRLRDGKVSHLSLFIDK